MSTRIKTRDLQIGNDIYTITLLPASVGIKVWERLSRCFGTAAGRWADEIKYQSLAEQLQNASGDEEGFSALIDKVSDAKDSSFFTDIAIAIVKNIGELDVVSTAQVLLKDSYFNSQPIVFDDHFAGNYGELIVLLEFAMKENFGSFFQQWLKAKGLETHMLTELVGNLGLKLDASKTK